MLTKEEKIQQVKEVIKSIVPTIMKIAPWLDFSQLHIGRDSEVYSDRSTEVYLFFQAATDKNGNYISDTNFAMAEYCDDIYHKVKQQLDSAETDYQIRRIKGGIWSDFGGVPDWKPRPKTGYYGIKLSVVYNDFEPGTIVKIKENWLDPGEAAGVEYKVVERRANNHVLVKLATPDPNRSIQSTWEWPIYTLYPASLNW